MNNEEFKNLELLNASMGYEPIGNNIPLKDFFQNSYCECGYDPNGMTINKRILSIIKKNKRVCESNLNIVEDNMSKKVTCPVRYGLSNHVTFPPVSVMSNVNEASDIYYDTETGTPKHHWAVILEINHILEHTDKRGFGGFNLFGDEIHVYFDIENNEEPTTFSWMDLKEGNTMAILYAEQKKFKNGDSAIIETNLDMCYIFRESLSVVNNEAQMLLLDADLMVKNQPSCFTCQYNCTGKVAVRCANCKLAKYCSKECQTYAWKEGHKRTCNQSETLLSLSTLSFLPFDHFFTFHTLPIYRHGQTEEISELKETNDKENQNVINSLNKLSIKETRNVIKSPKALGDKENYNDQTYA